MNRPKRFLLFMFVSACIAAAPAFSETGSRLAPPRSFPAASSPKASPGPAQAVPAPDIKVPPCGAESPAGQMGQRGVAPTEATTLTVGPMIGAVGDTIPLKAKLIRSKDGAPVRDHTVIFNVAGQAAGSAKTDTQGEAKVQYKVPAQIGSRPIGARYNGSALCASSTGQNNLGVVKSAVKMSAKVPSSHITLREGEGDTLKGKLFRITDNEGLDGRELTFLLDGKPLGTAATSPGGEFSQSFSMPPPSAGTHIIEVRYEGDSLYLGTTGKYAFEVLPKVKDAYLTWTGASGKVGQTVTVTARFGIGNPPQASNGISGKTIDFRAYRYGPPEYIKVLGEAVTDSQGLAKLTFKIEDPANTYDMSAFAKVSAFTDYDVKRLSKEKYAVSKSPVSVSAAGPASAAVGDKVSFTATVRRTTDNGPAANVEVLMTLDPASQVGVNAKTDNSGKATFQITVPYAYGTGTKTFTFASPESSRYLAGKGTLAFTIKPKSN